MAGILRGEVRWADLKPVRGSEQAGNRPVLILMRIPVKVATHSGRKVATYPLI